MATQTSNEFINRSPDQVTEKLREGFVWGSKHLALFAGVVCLLVVGAVVSFLSEKSTASKLDLANKDLLVVSAKIETEQKAFFETQKGKADPSVVFKPSQSLVDELAAKANQHSETTIGQAGLIEAARYYSASGKYEQSVALLEPVVKKAGSQLLKGLIIDELAYGFAAIKQCDKMSGLLKETSGSKEAYMKNMLLYRSALCLVEQNKNEEALLSLVSIKFDEDVAQGSIEKVLSKIQNPGSEVLRVRDPLREPVESLIKQIKLSKLAGTSIE